MGVRAIVKNGRLVVDEPTDLPEGTVLDLVVDDEGDDLSPEEIQKRDAALLRSWQQAQNGQTAPAEEILKKLRARSGS